MGGSVPLIMMAQVQVAQGVLYGLKPDRLLIEEGLMQKEGMLLVTVLWLVLVVVDELFC